MELSRRFLAERGDQALGLGPLRLLPPRKAHVWVLFWTAARRVDDSVESGQRSVEAWRVAVEDPSTTTLGERCIEAFLRRPEGAGTPAELRALMERGLDGLAREGRFDRPRPLHEYLDLIHDKSASAMLILDRLLFPGEPDAVLSRHAEAFAAATQVGDDCRDARRDLAAGRCFVTQEEMTGSRSVQDLVRSERFASSRGAMSGFLLERADFAAARFRIPGHRATAARLSTFWRHAIDSDQIRPTTKPLALPVGGKHAVAKPGSPPPRRILGVLSKRFPKR